MKCESCNKKHDGSYGSGRFCSSRCARGFSTKNKREEINKKVSKSLLGKKHNFNPSYVFSNEDRKKAAKSLAIRNREITIEKINEGKYVKSATLRPILLEWQNNKCAICGMEPYWNDKPIVFDIDHIDGDSSNYNKRNLRAVCPNCHRQTETFGGKNAGRGNTREYLKNYLTHEERLKILSEKRLKELKS